MSKQEKYEEWLARLDIPLEDTLDIERFREYLIDELGITGDLQLEALESVRQAPQAYAEHRIEAITVEYPWGKEVRYAIQGLAGLWGWESVQRIRAEEAW